MATYYPPSANQQDIMPTLYLKEPGHAQYTETAVQGSMYMNYASSGSYPEDIAGSSQNQQNNVELPVPNAATLMQASSMGASALLTSRLGDTQYNSWRDGGSELSFIQMPNAGGSNNRTGELMHTSGTNDPQMGLGTELGILHGQNLSLQQSNIAAVQGKGLSLTLSTQIPAHSLHYHPASSSFSFVGPHPTSGNVGSSREDNSGDKQMHVYQPSYGLSTLSSTLPNSRYLKVAQQLLDEVINVRKALKSKMDINEGPSSAGNAGGKESDEGSKSDGTTANPQESSANSTEVSPTERQDLQNKLTKLSAMLDEVDRRYKQYYHQMQIVVSSFDVIAGFGSAKPYTALALQTISRHFRCLRDAISGQIHATRKSLGEQESPTKGGGLSRLRFVDQQLRQQRAFQQFGMMQQHAWRPQRGLPENSVTILRAWLFEHFLHPYPKDSDKIMLARQTGLTRNQVSNWFINARVRLWKPMVEEMYKEEIGDAELDTNSSSENATKGKDDARSSEDHEDSQSMKSVTEMSQSRQLNNSSRSTALSDMEMNGVATSFKNEVSAEHTSYMNINPRGQDSNTHDNNLLQHTFIQNDGSGRFMDYQVAGLGRYGNAGVSLTLGLQHCEGGLPVSDGQHSFVSVRGDAMLNVVPSLGADAADYNYLNLADTRHRFGPSQLLHDFVA